jgi:hypothetical protein
MRPNDVNKEKNNQSQGRGDAAGTKIIVGPATKKYPGNKTMGGGINRATKGL